MRIAWTSKKAGVVVAVVPVVAAVMAAVVAADMAAVTVDVVFAWKVMVDDETSVQKM